jgi:RHS repeat-associated protein
VSELPPTRAAARAVRRRVRRTAGIAALVLSVTATLTVAVPAQAAPPAKPAKAAAHKETSVPAGPARAVTAAPRNPAAAAALHSAPAVAWPAATDQTINLTPATAVTARRAVTVPAAPVTVDAPVPPGTAPTALTAAQRAATPARVRVRVYDHDASQAGGYPLTFAVSRADAVPAAGQVSLSVRYSGFARAYGADFGSRLRLVAVPGCADTTPAAAGCTPVPLASANDRIAGTVTALADVPASGAVTLALTAGADSDSGDFKATPLKPSATWTAGEQSGDFSWSYPMRVPPGLGGPEPAIALDYSSQSVDGEMAASNNQPGPIGEGFSYSPGSITRNYKACADDMGGDSTNKTKTGDQCWGGDNATLQLSGHAGELIKDDDGGGYHLKNDDNTKVELLTGATNGDDNGEYWQVTTPDGTQYYFGRNRISGWKTNDPVTNSVQTVPVFGNNPGEPCYNASFAKAYCDQAYQWNLDYVVDPHGNTESFWYGSETNHYARDNTTSTVSAYDRGGYLVHIDYGTDNRTAGRDSDFDTKAPMRVDFANLDRCVAGATCDTGHPNSWPDVPWDQSCTSTTSCKNTSATFFSQKRLDSVTTSVWNAATSGYDKVEKWTLHQSYPDPGDTTRAGLWLDSISHQGLYGSTTSMPDVKFTGIQLANRVDTATDNTAKMNWWRISSIRTESGDLTGITYSSQQCVAGSTPSPSNNDKLCYPVYWTRPTKDKPAIDWFNKYVVKVITDNDQTGGAPRSYTTYDYDTTGPMWHYDDDNGLVSAAQKTWGQWRGYASVVTTSGEGADTRTQTKSLYFQGMNGDKTADGTRTATVVDSAGTGKPDDDPFAGQVREQITYNGPGGAEVSGTINDLWKSAATATRTVAGYTKRAYHTGVSATYTRTALDGGRGYQRTETDTALDAYGLPTQVLDKGDVGKSTDDVCTINTYNRNTTKNILGTIGRVQKYTASCATPAGEAGVVSDDEYSFDGQAYGTAPKYGDITRTQKAKAWSSPTSVTWLTEGTSVFDAYGRAYDVTDVRGNHTKTAFTPASGGPVTKLTQTADPFGWQTVTELNPAYNVATAKIDQNLKRTDTTYDGLGRKTAIWLSNRSMATQSANGTFSYQISQADNVPSVVVTNVINATGHYNASYQFYDGLLRVRQKQEPGVGGGRTITDTFYNSLGQTARISGPYFNGDAGPSATLFPRPVDQSVPSATLSSYDGDGREIAKATLAYNVTQWQSTTAYGGDHTDVTPEQGGTPTSTWTDALGRTIEMRQYPGGAPTGSTYNSSRTTYDVKGQRSTLTDDAGNVWSYTYDLLGRTTSVTDPDSGTSTSTFDDAGDVLTVADANNAADPAHNPVTFFDYDAAGRKVGEYLTGKTGTQLAAWTYDTLQKGQLSSSSTFVAGNEYKTAILGYNALYKSAGTTVTVPTNESALAGTYTTVNTYNVDGSINSSSLPQTGDLPAENLNYAYDDTTGLVSSLKTDFGGTSKKIVLSAQYTSFGERAITTFADSDTAPWAQQILTYDPSTRRLSENKTIRSVDTAAVSDIHQDWDAAGNMTRSADTPAGGTADVQCFSYDSLLRLTQAWTPGNSDCQAAPTAAGLGGAAPYWKSWTFDGSGVDASTGNRLTETSHTTGGDTTVASHYDNAAHPHAVTSTTVNGSAGGTFGYDPNGDTTSRTGPTGQQALSWDADGHLKALTDSSGQYSYVYDADGQRLVQHTPTGTTLYLDGTELTLSTTGVTTAQRTYEFDDQPVAQRTAAGLQFLVNDPHGTSTIAVKDDATLAVTRRYQDPYGNSRGPAVTWVGPKSFVGGDLDPTGLIHEGAREYDTLLGRFVSVDPQFDDTQPQSWNNYAYSNNNPVGFSDPNGTGWGWLKKTVSVVAEVASVASIIPGPIGMVASGVSAAAYAAEGDYKNAAIAVAGIALSAVGAGAAVVAVKAAKAAKAAKGVIKAAEDVDDVVKTVKVDQKAAKLAAEEARDALAEGKGKNWAATYTGVWNPETGEVAAGFSGRGTEGCAEACGKDFLGLSDRAARFTKAFGWFPKVKGGPKVWQERPICVRCQERYSPRQFPRRVKYASGGRWDTDLLTRIVYLLRFIGLL